MDASARTETREVEGRKRYSAAAKVYRRLEGYP